MQKLTILCAVALLAAAGALAAPATEQAASMEPTVLTVVLGDRGTAPINVDSAVIDAIEERLNITFDLTARRGRLQRRPPTTCPTSSGCPQRWSSDTGVRR